MRLGADIEDGTPTDSATSLDAILHIGNQTKASDAVFCVIARLCATITYNNPSVHCQIYGLNYSSTFPLTEVQNQ